MWNYLKSNWCILLSKPKIAIVLLFLLSLSFSANVPKILAWYETSVEIGSFYVLGKSILKMGSVTWYAYNESASETNPHFYSSLIADGGNIGLGFFYPEMVKIEVSGVDPHGNSLSGDRFGGLTTLASPDGSTQFQDILRVIFQSLAAAGGVGWLNPMLQYTMSGGGATTGCDSEKAWGMWQRPPLATVEESKGLRFGYFLVVDPGVVGVYTINIHYNAWVCNYDGVTIHHAGFLDLYQTVYYDYDPLATRQSPYTPSNPAGFTSGYSGVPYTFSTNTTDPNGENVRYQFDWNDGTFTNTIWCASGTRMTASHYWHSTGIYYIRVRAQDSSGHWSGWSLSLAVEILSPPSGGRDWDIFYCTY
jgi:hypothetical protein